MSKFIKHIAFFFLIISINIFGKGINKKFIVSADRGSITYLIISKNNTYKYVKSNIDYDWVATIDSGSYNILKDVITFISNTEAKSFSNKKYFIKTINIKSYEWFNSMNSIYSKKKTLNGYQITFLNEKKDTNSKIYSERPIDNIITNYLDTLIDRKEWIVNQFTSLQFQRDEILNAKYDTLFSSKNIEVISVYNEWGDLFKIFYFSGNKIYQTNLPRLPEYQKAVISKCYRENLLNLKERNILSKDLDSFLIGNIKGK